MEPLTPNRQTSPLQSTVSPSAETVHSSLENSPNTHRDRPFQVGDEVIYGVYGKCRITEVKLQDLSGQKTRLYKLEISKSPLSRSHKKEPAIWIPVDSARDKGLRWPMSLEQAHEALRLLGSREYYFPLHEPWSRMRHQLEDTIRRDGSSGLAKVASYLYVRRKKQISPLPETSRFQESVNRQLIRELSEVLTKAPRELEDELSKSMKPKLLSDH